MHTFMLNYVTCKGPRPIAPLSFERSALHRHLHEEGDDTSKPRSNVLEEERPTPHVQSCSTQHQVRHINPRVGSEWRHASTTPHFTDATGDAS
jgi:hypothetical protein